MIIATRNIAVRRVPVLQRLLWSTALVSGLAAAMPALAQVLPVVAVPGGATVTTVDVGTHVGFGLDVNLNDANRVINWSSFNIGSASSKFETVRFITADTSTSFAVLNRVATGNPSSIFGQITSQPKITVWLVNPSGITFGPTGSFSGGALVLSTAALTVDDTKFLGGVLPINLTGHDTAAGATGIVLKAGSGLLATAGPIVLVAQSIDASGTISATGGDVALVAATDVTLPNAFGSPLAITITKGTALASAKVDAKGAIDGANVRFYGARQADVVAALLNVSTGATLTATSAGGKVVLAAGTAAAGTGLSFAGALPADIDGVANIAMSAGTLTATGLGGTVFAAANGSLSGAASLVANTTGGAITLNSGSDILGTLNLSATGGGATVTLPAGKNVALGTVATRDAFTLDTTGTIATGDLTVTNGSVLLRTTTVTGGSITAGTIAAFNNVTVDAHTAAQVTSAAAGVANLAGPLPDPTSDIKVDAVTNIDFGGGSAPRDITLTAANGYAKVTGALTAGRNVAVSALNDTATVASDVTAATGFYTVDGKTAVLGTAGIVPVTQQAAGFVRINAVDAVNGLGALTLQSNSGGAADVADARYLQLSATAGPINFAATTSLLGGTAKQSLLVLNTATPISLGLVRARRLVPLGSLGAPVFTTAGDFTAADLGVAGDLAITSTAGSIRLGTATSDTGDIKLTAAAGDISGLATIAPGNLVPNFDRADLTVSGADRTVDVAAKRVQLGTVTAGTGSTLLAADQIHVLAEAFDVTGVDARNGDVTLTATAGTATLGTGTVKGNLQVDATTAAAVTGAVTAGGFYKVTGSTATLGNASTVTQKAGDYVQIAATAGAITGRPNLTLQSNSGGAADPANTRYLQLAAAWAIDFGPATSLLAGTANQSVLALNAGTTIGLGTVRARQIVPTADLTAAAFSTAGDFIASDIIVAGTLDVTSTGGSIRIGQATSQTGNIALTTTSAVAGTGDISGLATVALPLTIDDYGRADLTTSTANTTVIVRAIGAPAQTAKLGTLTAGAGTGLLAADQVFVTAGTVDVSTITARNGNLLLQSTTNETRLGTGSARGNTTVQTATSARIGSAASLQGNVDVRALAGDISGLLLGTAATDGRLLAGYDRAGLAANAANATVFAQGSNVQLGTVAAGTGTGLLAADQITILGTVIDTTSATANNGNLLLQSSVDEVRLGTGSARGNTTVQAATSARIGSAASLQGNVDVRALAGDVSGLVRSAAATDGRLLTGYDRAGLAANAANATVFAQGSNVQLGTVAAGTGTGLLAADQITILGTAIDATTATASNGNLFVQSSVGDAVLAIGSARGNATVHAATNARIGSLTALQGNVDARALAGDISGLLLGTAATDGRLLAGYDRAGLAANAANATVFAQGSNVQLGTVAAGTGTGLLAADQITILGTVIDAATATASNGNLVLLSSIGEAILATGSARGSATVRGGTSARIGTLTSLAGAIEAKGLAGDVSGLALGVAAVDGRLLAGYGRSDLTAATGVVVSGYGVQLGAVAAGGDITINGGNSGALRDGAIDITSVAATDGSFTLTSYSGTTGAPIYNGNLVLGSGTTDRTGSNPPERDGTITASGSVSLGSARTSRTLSITAGKSVTVAGPVTAGENITGDYLVTGSSVTLAGTVQSASGRVDIHATGTLPGDGISGLAGLVLASNRDSAGSSPLTLRADGGAGIDFATGTSLFGGTTAGIANQTADIGIWSPLASLALGTVTARSLQGLDAGHTAFAALSAPNTLNVTGNVDLRAPVTLAGALNLVSAAGAITTRAITVGTPGPGTADRFLTLTATLGTITATDPLLSDGNLTLTAKDAIALLSATSRLGDIVITSSEGDVTGLGGVSGSYAPFAIGALGSTLSPAGTVTLTLPGNASVTAIDATGNISITGSDIRLGRANSAAGSIGITATGALTGIGTAAGSGGVPPIPGADLTASASTGSITVNAGGAILKTAQLHTVTAGRDVTVTADRIAIDSAAASTGTLRLNAGSLLALGAGFGSAIMISGTGGVGAPLVDPDYAANILDRNFGATDLTATADGKTITLGVGTIAQLGFITAGTTATAGSTDQIGITTGSLTANTLTARNGDIRAAAATGPLYVRTINAANTARLVKTGNSSSAFDELRLDTLTSGTAAGAFGDVVVTSATDARIGTLTATNGDVQLSSTAASADRGLVQIGNASTSGTTAGHRDLTITGRRVVVTTAAGALNGSMLVTANQTGAARNEVSVVATRLFAGTDLTVDAGLGTAAGPAADNGSVRLGNASATTGSITMTALDGNLTGLAATGIDAIDTAHGRMLLGAGTNIALTAGGLIQTGLITATAGTITAAAGDVFTAGLAANDGAIDISQANSSGDLSLWAKAMTSLGTYNGDIRLGGNAAGQYDGTSAATTSGGIAHLETMGLRGDVIMASALVSTGNLTIASIANVRLAGGDPVPFTSRYAGSTAGTVAITAAGDVSGLAGSGPLLTGFGRGDVTGFGGLSVSAPAGSVQLGTVRTVSAAAGALGINASAIDIVAAQASAALAMTATTGRLFLDTGTAGGKAALTKQGSVEELRITGNLLAGSDVLIDTQTNARLPGGSATTRVTSTAGSITVKAAGDATGLALGTAATDGRLLPGFGRGDLTTLDTGSAGKAITVTAANAQLGAVNAGGTSLASLISVTAGAVDIVSAASAGDLSLTATTGRLFLDTGTAGGKAALTKQGSVEELRITGNLLAGSDVLIDTQTNARLPGGAADRFVRATAGDITITARTGDVTGSGGVTGGFAGFAAGDLTSLGGVIATLPDNAAIGSITAAGDITLTSGNFGDIRLGSATTSGGSILIDARSGALSGTAAGGFAVPVIPGSDLFATGSGHSVTVVAGTGGALGTAQLGTVRAGRNITVTADRIAIDDARAATGALTLNAGSMLALRLGSGGSIALAGTGNLASVAVADYANDLLDTGYGASNLTASADGKTVTIRAGTIAQLGTVAAGTTASTGITKQIDITGGAVTADALTARNAVVAVNATNGPLYVHTVDAANAATFTKTGNAGTAYDEIRLRTVTSGAAPGSTGTIAVTSDTSARIGTLTATTGDIAVKALAGDVSGLLLPVASTDGRLLPAFDRAGLTTRSANAITVTAANGNIQLGTVTAGADTAAAAATATDQLTGTARAIDITAATASNGNLNLTATANDVTLQTGDARSAATIDASRNAVIASLTARTQGLTVTTHTGDVILGEGTAQTNATVNAAASARIGTLTATAGNLAITATTGSISGLAPGVAGSLLPDFGRAALTAGGTGTLTAANGAIQLGTVTTAGTLTGSAQAIDISTAGTGSALTLTSTAGDVILGAGTAQTDATVNAAASARIGTLTATAGNLAITATTGSISGLAPGVAGSLLPDFGRAALTAGGTGTLTAANGAIQLGTVTTAGTLTGSAQAIDISTAGTGSALTLTSTAGDVILGAGTAQTNATVNAAASARIGTLTAATGTIDVTATAGSISGPAPGTAGNLLPGFGRAVLATAGNAQAITLTADLGSIQLGKVTTVNGPVTLIAASADLGDTIAAGSSTIRIVRGSAAAEVWIGDNPADAIAGTKALALSEAEINRLKAKVVQISTTPLATQGATPIRIGKLAIATDTGSTRLQFLGTGVFTLSGTISDAGAVARTLQIGGAAADLPLAAGITAATPLAARIDATITAGAAGAIVNLPQATLDLRAQRIDFGTAGFLTDIAAATGALGDAAAAQKVAADFVANAGSRLYHDAGLATPPGNVYLTAKLLQASYSSFALFQNTGTPSVGAGVVIGVPGNSVIAPTVLELRSLGETPVNAFALFGTVNAFIGRTAGLLPAAVLSFADDGAGGRIVRITQSNSRVNGCVIGSPDKGCLVTDVPPPTLQLFDQRQLQLFGVADDLTVPFDPLIGSSNESLIGDITTTAGVGDCTVPGAPNCPVQGERP